MLFIIGLAVGAALMWLVLWLQSKEITIRWYEWLLAGLGFVLLIWAVNDYFGSIAEHNQSAAGVILGLLGTPAIILLGMAVFLAWRRIRRFQITTKPKAKKQFAV
jgi:hypothetical protein